MPPLEDAELLKCFRGILSNWNVTDYVTAKDEALEWAGRNLPFVVGRSAALHRNRSRGLRPVRIRTSEL